MSSTTTVTQTNTRITAENVLHLFPEVNTTVIGAARPSGSENDLAGYDEEQIRLMDEVCIVLDENDVPIGSASKKACMFPTHPLNAPGAFQEPNIDSKQQAIS
jgi:isopentenyl-diphosphate delta-isomerase